MLVVFIGGSKCFCKVNMMSAAYIDCRRRSAAELMIVAVTGIGMEYDFVYMASVTGDSLS